VTRILIVDDNARVRAALRVCLKMKEDWIVCGEAENGDAAIELVRTVKPDVVLLDYAMPVMNGLEAARVMSGLAPECSILMHTMFATPQLGCPWQNGIAECWVGSCRRELAGEDPPRNCR
jgi:DNA-binding NarL/FixJ family response regulator